ncbi:peptidylprolyl isomerase [uncultured Dokdonia sp.]|uniref:peptidylprolyl isomerase n=1 Tax=uncultured Dokdonia sp. TaxID=575653 RepID=UPI002627C031|nr:peptidylprolyl isomerase [uncultured Dokdonia sp.]
MRYLFIVCFLFSFALMGQEKVLLKVNDEEVSTEEFIRVYEKNLSLIKEVEHNSPKQYLDLFIDYKLKVQEAYKQGLDKKQAYQKEIASYRSQLAKNYLNDVQVTDDLVKEAYFRSKNELRARHILIRLRPDALPKDTLVAYNKLIAARNRIIKGEDFNKIARIYSEDPSAKQNGGDLGWFKAFKMVYPFENAAYSTPIQEVSMPFRTNFGYHIVQPTATRISQGTVQVAHIMVSLNQKDSTVSPAAKIIKVKELLDSGADFETLALNYSDDKNTAKKGGVINAFEKGQLSSDVFEKTAFNLKSIGEISEPFKTKFGWHILKLVKKNPLQAFEEIEASLTQKVTRDARARVLSEALYEKLRKKYNVTEEVAIVEYFTSVLPEVYNREEQLFTDKSALTRTAFTIGDETFLYSDIAKVIDNKLKRKNYTSRSYFVENEVANFINDALKTYHLAHLEEENPEFRSLINEYKEGLLLFDLLESQIWKKAQKDSVGLRAFYNANAQNYKTPKVYNTRVFTTKQKGIATTYRKRLLKGEKSEIIIEALKVKYKSPLIVSNREIVEENFPFSGDNNLGVKKVITEGDNYILYEVLSIDEAKFNTLAESRGAVMSDYQKYLETNFVKELRKNSEINVNTTILNNLEKRYYE